MKGRCLNIKVNWLTVAGFILMITAVISILLFFMSGETQMGGEWTIEQTNSLICEASEINYPFFEYDNSDEKTIKINMTLEGDYVKTTSLMYTLNYNNEQLIINSENLNRITMNENFAKDNLGFDALGLKFSKFSDGLQMSLFANSDKINNTSIKYFMLDKIDNISLSDIQKSYETQGFICQKKN